MTVAANTGRYRAGVLALLLAATTINSFDRASLSVAAPFISREFGISASVMGIALSAFFWSYVAGNLLGGRLVDSLGSKIVLGGALAIWSVFSAATGLAQTIIQVVVARLGVGLAEGPSFPTAAKIFAGNFPTRERGVAVGINAAGARIGLALCPIVMTLLIARWGWRIAFVVTGIGSLAWVAVWWATFTDRSADALAPGGKISVPWRRIISNPAIVSLIAVKFCQDFLQWLFLTWIPSYLITGRHFSTVEMGFYTSLAFTVAFVAQPLIGFFSDWLIRRGWSVDRARKTVQVALQLLSATIVVTGFAHDTRLALIVLTIAVAAESTCAGHIWTIIADVIPARYIGSVSGLINAIGALAGIASPIITGMVVDVTGSFALAFAIGSAIMLVATLVLVFAVPSLDHTWTEPFDDLRPHTASPQEPA